METGDESDWRLQGQQKYLEGAALVPKQYRRHPRNSDWDHDHCAFCWATFMVEDVPGVLHQGYCTLDEYHWICPTCFADFREQFAWTVVEGA